MTLFIRTNLENMTTLYKTAKQQIYPWIVSTVKITNLQTWNIHTFKESTWCKKYVLVSISWFGPFHQATVPCFNFGCMAEIPESRKIIHH